jgi:phage terminase small subunit
MALSAKHRAFINEYLIDFNATRAAQRAGYGGDENTLAVTGGRLLRIDKISEAIQNRLRERAMAADEVLGRLADHARGSMADFIKLNEKGQPFFDLEAARDAGKLHLVKKLKTKTRSINIGRPDTEKGNTDSDAREDEEAGPDEAQANDSLSTEVTIEFELYDAQAALSLLGKHHKLFADKLDVHHTSSPDYTADERAKAQKELSEWIEQQKKNAATSNG